jgi:zinc D-Ala-D-Ala carboxypeptidase
MTIVSGFRCVANNAKQGGAKNSQHLIGLAADILVTSDAHRHLLISALLAFNFKRIGIGKSIIHADIGTITGPVIWTYYP